MAQGAGRRSESWSRRLREGLLALSVGVCLGVLAELMEEEVVDVVGARSKPDPARSAWQIAQPFERTFTRTDLDRLLARIDYHQPHLKLAA